LAREFYGSDSWYSTFCKSILGKKKHFQLVGHRLSRVL
jgi:hypothetical protein